MEQEKTFNAKLTSLVTLLFVVGIIFLAIYFRNGADGKLHLIFCDVGQGDAILIITPAGQQILVDGGPDNSVLSCLGKNLPFYDRTLELVVLTHPQADHLTGLVSVFQNFTIAKFLETGAINNTPEFAAFKTALENERPQRFQAVSGAKINLGKNLQAKILWPLESTVITSDLNEASVVLRLDYGSFCSLLTGDATNKIWFRLATTGQLKSCHLVKIAHHGSKNATNDQFLDLISPKIGVISVGLTNRYGHPHSEVLEELEKRRIQILRTDEKGTIEVVTDGKKVKVGD